MTHPQALVAKFAGRKFWFKDDVYDLWVNIVHPEISGRNKVVFGRAASKHLKRRWIAKSTHIDPTRRYLYTLEHPIKDPLNEGNNLFNININMMDMMEETYNA